MKILLTNDDGISSPNIKLLAKRLSENGHHVFVFAPHTQKSACSQSLTVHQAFGYTETKDYFGAECAVAVEGHSFGLYKNCGAYFQNSSGSCRFRSE